MVSGAFAEEFSHYYSHCFFFSFFFFGKDDTNIETKCRETERRTGIRRCMIDHFYTKGIMVGDLGSN